MKTAITSLVFLLLCPALSAQMTLLETPESDPGISAVDEIDSFFDEQETVLDFDEFEHEEKVNDKLKKQGVTFSSSNDDGAVSANLYSFAKGRSKKMCIAGANPTYQGKMTIKFTDENIGSVGFLISHVNPGGTLVDVFDADGDLLGRLGIPEGAGSGTVFCGIKSKKPIAKLIISPVPEVDEDFALDDLAFSKVAAKGKTKR